MAAANSGSVGRGKDYSKYSNMLSKAIEIAVRKHNGQFRKQGEPSILHPIRVMVAGKSLEEKIVGVLHDVIEDTDAILTDFTHLFPLNIIKSLDAITHRQFELRDNYYKRVKEDEIALAVKENDINDNESTLEEIKDERTRERLRKKYQYAREVLWG